MAEDATARLLRGPEAAEEVDTFLDAVRGDYREQLASGDWRRAQNAAVLALHEEGRWFAPKDPSVQLLAGEMLKTRVRLAELLELRQRGHVVEAPAAPPLQPDRTPETGTSVAELIAAYRADREAQFGKESTARKYGHIFKALEESIGGEKVVSAVTRADCRGVRDLLQKLPASAGKKYRGLSLTQAVEAGARDGAAPLAPNTVKSYLQNLSAVFNWAEREGLIETNPAVGLAGKSRARIERRAFTPKELGTLFGGLAEFRTSVPSRFWVPALGLYTGARLNELCQLSAADVGTEDELAYLDFSEFDAETGERVSERSLKTEGSARRVPIHKDLVETGFLDFVRDVVERGGGRLFPECRKGPDGLFSHGFSKWFGRFCSSQGLTARSLVFHSFRHGFRDACRDAAVPAETAEALGGWSSAGVASGYGNRGRLALLARESAKVAFGEFRLAAVVAPGPAEAA
jgi:integrase